MIETLTLLAPGDRSAPGRCHLMLTDARAYDAALFARVAREVFAGPGISCDTTGAGPVFRVTHAEALALPAQIDARVLFFVATDTDVKTLAPVARRCRVAEFVLHPDGDRSAERALEREQFSFERNRPGGAVPRAQAALLTSDWSAPRREFIRRCRRAGVPTLVLQEAVNVDFDGPPHRMRWADAVCVSGVHALRYLRRDIAFLTGNPRFDGHAPAPRPAKPLVLINSNFMLGFGGEHGHAWIDLAIAAVQTLNLDYRITKHPRDDTDLRGVPNVAPSGAYTIREQLAACSVLVTRDSSLAYEALLRGRPVIYFDPFHEKERTLREDDSGLVHKCTSIGDLREALAKTAPLPPRAAGTDAEDEPFSFLFTQPGAGSTERVLRALHAVAASPDLYRGTDALEDRGARALAREWAELHLRPALRRIGPLRALWRAGRRITGA